MANFLRKLKNLEKTHTVFAQAGGNLQDAERPYASAERANEKSSNTLHYLR
jgi:hypothetical protein